MFRNREDAALQLARCFKGRMLCDPLVLAIPRGGVLIGAVLARELDAELDVVQSIKLLAPGQPHIVIGAVSEDGQIYLNPQAKSVDGLTEGYLKAESGRQLATMEQRRKLFLGARPRATVRGRSVIIADDGIATGSTMIAALGFIKKQNPYELLVAVPVASPEGLQEVRHWCDDDVRLVTPEEFRAIDEFYEGFPTVEDRKVIGVLRRRRSRRRRKQPMDDLL